MELRTFTEPQQGATYDDLLAVALASEAAGYAGFMRSDHYLVMGGGSGLPGPTHAWITLAGLARDTNTIRLGTLVSPATFYQPGPLAIAVAQVDQMSGGRIDFGFGAGWYEAEHGAYGLDFPEIGERFDRYEEYLEQIVGLWSTPEGETYSHQGQFHSFTDSPALPKPTQRPGPPVIIGGRGKTRTPRLVARYASDFNVPFMALADIAETIARVDAACEAIDRDPSTVVKSAALIACVGATGADIKRRAAAIGRDVDELRENGVAGTYDEAIAKLADYAAAGIDRVYLQFMDPADLDHVSEIGANVLPAAAGL
ncbi:MAG: LLM class F420-dependent oxidoreductase [Acidimicrobiales bacterium]